MSVDSMIQKVFGSKSHVKVLMFLYKLSRVRNETTMKELERRTGISRVTLVKVVSDLIKTKIVAIRGATKGQVIRIVDTPQKKVVWGFIKDFERSFYMRR